jgi:hypothetical protein
MSLVAHVDTRPAQRDLPATSAQLEISLPAAPLAGEQARRLYREARFISLEHIKALQLAMAEARDLARATVDGGDLYVVGLQDYAARLAQELFWRGKSLEALTERQRVAARVR